MREAFAHEAILTMASDADTQAPGAAVTVALCGRWEHEPPCPLAPHHTQASRLGGDLRVRTLFAAEPGLEDKVRDRIDRALAGGELVGPVGAETSWRLQRSYRSTVTEAEAGHAERLTRS